uniref:tetraspanin-15 n=1 Tax=Erigeron canadensis TaxID=72917 RepID=UPI001CB9696F|nr:tetraspanin-15 [Erigeron canadensis]
MAENANSPTIHDVIGVDENPKTPTTPKAGNVKDRIPTMPGSIKSILFALNTITFLLSFPVLFCIVWLLYVKESHCEHLLPLSKLQVGVVAGLLVLFVISNAVVLLRSRFIMLALIAVMVPLIVILTIGFALVGAFRLDGGLIPGSPSWIKIMVSNDTNWNAIETCIYKSRTCQDLAVQSSMIGSNDFSRRHLSPIESGCCIPPSNCDMTYVSVTYWEKNPEADDSSNGGSYNGDCDVWQNKATKLCYECHACRKGFISTLSRKWYKLGVFLVVETVLLIVSHLLLFVATMWERTHASW